VNVGCEKSCRKCDTQFFCEFSLPVKDSKQAVHHYIKRMKSEVAFCRCPNLVLLGGVKSCSICVQGGHPNEPGTTVIAAGIPSPTLVSLPWQPELNTVMPGGSQHKLSCFSESSRCHVVSRSTQLEPCRGAFYHEPHFAVMTTMMTTNKPERQRPGPPTSLKGKDQGPPTSLKGKDQGPPTSLKGKDQGPPTSLKGKDQGSPARRCASRVE